LLSFITIPKSLGEALSHLEWPQAMIYVMCSLQRSGSWELVPLPASKSIVGCRWLYTHQTGPNGNIDHYEVQLVAK